MSLWMAVALHTGEEGHRHPAGSHSRWIRAKGGTMNPLLCPEGDLWNPLALRMSESLHPHPAPHPHPGGGHKKILSPSLWGHGLERCESSVVAGNKDPAIWHTFVLVLIL